MQTQPENTVNDTFKLSDLSDQDLENLLAARKQSKEDQRQAYKKLIPETVPVVIKRLLALSALLSQEKAEAFSYCSGLLELKAEVFGVKDSQQSHTFSDDESSITVGYRINEGWDDTAATGVKKVTDFIQSLARDTNSGELVDIVFGLLKKDAKGNLRASRVLELQKLTTKFNDVNFTDGVNIIMAAYKPVRSVYFIEASTVDAEGNPYKFSIPLSMSAVGFPAGFEFPFFDKKG
jgi:hypothetical protein